jgi:hypothetical protein
MFKLSNTSRSNAVTSNRACFHCQSFRTLATRLWTLATSVRARDRALEPFCLRLKTR